MTIYGPYPQITGGFIIPQRDAGGTLVVNVSSVGGFEIHRTDVGEVHVLYAHTVPIDGRNIVALAQAGSEDDAQAILANLLDQIANDRRTITHRPAQ